MKDTERWYCDLSARFRAAFNDARPGTPGQPLQQRAAIYAARRGPYDTHAPFQHASTQVWGKHMSSRPSSETMVISLAQFRPRALIGPT